VDEQVLMAKRGRHILVVDDYADARDVWALYLRSLGYDVSTAADGTTAVARAEQLHPDVIMLDLEMPGISGFEAARRLRRTPSTHDIPLIAATGYSHERQIAMARDSGFDEVVVKPIDPDSLVDHIERLVDATVVLRQPSHTAREAAQENG
jgi:CheY-like chemotaxis protein